MKKFILYIILCCFGFSLGAQTFVAESTSFGNELFNVFSSQALVHDKTGNTYMVIYAKDNFNFDGQSNFSFTGLQLIKVNLANKVVWTKNLVNTYNQSQIIGAISLSVDKVNNLILNYSFADSIQIDSTTYRTAGQSDIIISMLDTSGKYIYINQYGGAYTEICATNMPVAFDDKNNLLFIGTTNFNNQNVDTISIGSNLIISKKANVLLIKLDPSGLLIWAKSIGSSGNELGEGLCIVNQSMYYIIGNLNPGSTYNLQGKSTTIPWSYDDASILIKSDSSGNAKWIKHFGVTSTTNSFKSDLISTFKNKISIVSKGDVSRYEYENGATKFGSGDYSYCIATYDTNGTFLWNTVAQGFGEQNIADVEYGSNGKLYALGYMNFWSYFPNDTLHSQGGNDLLLVCYDSTGQAIWAKNGGGMGADITRGLAFGSDQSIYVSGATTSANFSIDQLSEPTPGSRNLFLLKLSPVALSVSNIDHTVNTINVYPNPASTNLNIRWQKENIEQISLYDLTGQRVLQRTIQAGQKHCTIELANGFSKGVYLLKLSGHHTSFSKKIEIK